MTEDLNRIRLSLLVRRDELARVGAMVDPVRLINDVLEEIHAIAKDDGELLKLTEAAERSGYTPDHIGALVRRGLLPNYGRPHAPRVRAADLPRKPGTLTVPLSRANVSVQIAREVAHSHSRRSDDQA